MIPVCLPQFYSKVITPSGTLSLVWKQHGLDTDTRIGTSPSRDLFSETSLGASSGSDVVN